MLTTSQILAIIMLLTAFGVDQNTISIVEHHLTPPTVIIENIKPQGTAQPEPQNQVEPLSTQIKQSMSELQIIDPIPGKGRGRQYIANLNGIENESNYIELGLVLRNDDGKPVNNLQVTITATDSTQNKTLNSTGNVKKIYKDGVPELVHYYPFHYEFKTAGTHTITFSANDMQEVVVLEVLEPAE